MNTQKVLVNAVREVQIEGKPSFVALDLVQLKAVKSKVTGKDYIATVKASVTTNLSKVLAETLIGQELSGTIQERDLPAEKHRDWKNPRTGEMVRITKERIWVA
jgi:hypothetical protein